MITKYCNLTGQEYILVNHFRVYVINDKSFSPHRIQLTFHSELILMWSNQPQTNKIPPWQVQACLGVTGHTGSHLTSSSSLTIYLSLITISMQKI